MKLLNWDNASGNKIQWRRGACEGSDEEWANLRVEMVTTTEGCNATGGWQQADNLRGHNRTLRVGSNGT